MTGEEISPVAPRPVAQGATPEVPAVPTTVVVVPAPKPKRRRWIVAVVVLGIIVLLLVIAFLIAESVAKNYARDYVRDRFVEVLGLPDDAEIDVDLGDGSIIVQALRGRVETVVITAPDVAFGELSGDAEVRAEGVPLDDTQPVERLSVDFSIGPDDLAFLSSGNDSLEAPSIEFDDGEIALSSQFTLFGAVVPLAISLEPGALDGALVLTPTTVTIGDAVFESGDSSFLGQLASQLFATQTVCLAGSLPQALVIDDAVIDDGRLVLTFDGSGSALGGSEWSTVGVCP